MKVQIRLTTAAAPMAELHAQAFDDAWSEADFEVLLANPGVVCILARIPTDAPVGFILARIAADEAEILTLAVSVDHRRHGVGRKLLEAAAWSALRAGAKRLFLEVAEDNIAAIALYEAAGFSRVGRRAGYYRHGGGRADALTLRRDLNR